MRILYFLAHPESLGGAMKVLLTQAFIMKSLGHTVKVIVQADLDGKYVPEYDILCEQYDVDYCSAIYPIATCIEKIDIFACEESYYRVKDIITSFHPDLIHTVQLNTTVEFISRELEVPHIMNIYPVSCDTFEIDWLDIFPRFHSCDSEFYCNLWREGLGVITRCIRVAYEVNRQYDISKHKEYEFIAIAAFYEYKCQLQIIKFIELCKKNGIAVHLTFLGNDNTSYGRICKDYVFEHDLDNNISFAGQVANVDYYLQNADIMVHASIAESFPGVLIEAIANRVFVITKPIAGIPELFCDGDNCLFVFGDSENDIFECFMRYISLDKHNSISNITTNAYGTYLSNNTYQVVGKALETYYQEIVRTNAEKRSSMLLDDVLTQINNMFSSSLWSDFSKKAIWYLYHIKEIVLKKEYKTAIIWGAGNLGAKTLEWCEILGLSVLGFMDTNKKGTYLSYPVWNEAELINLVDVIFVAVGSFDACKEICKKLEDNNWKRNDNYFLVNNNPCL